MAEAQQSPSAPAWSPQQPQFWAADLLHKAGIPDDMISQILGDAATQNLFTVPTPANPGAPPPNRAVEAPDPGTFLRGPQAPIEPTKLIPGAAAGGQPQINVQPNYPSTVPAEAPGSRYAPRSVGTAAADNAKIQALRAQLQAAGLSDQQINQRIATLQNPVETGTTALSSQPAPTDTDLFGGGVSPPSDIGSNVQKLAGWLKQTLMGQPQSGAGQAPPGPAAKDPNIQLLMQSMFGNNPQAATAQFPPGAGQPGPPHTPTPQAPDLNDNAAAQAAVAQGRGVPYTPGAGPGPGPGPAAAPASTAPDVVGPDVMAPVPTPTPRQDVSASTPTSDWNWEDLLQGSLNLMAAGEPQPGATIGPSFMGAVGRAGSETLRGKKAQRQAAQEAALKGRELDIRQQDVTETGKLREQLQEYDRTDKEIQRQLQGMQVNTSAYTAISNIRQDADKRLKDLQSTMDYIQLDDAGKAEAVKQITDQRDADVAAVQRGIGGAAAGTASPAAPAPTGKGPGPLSGTGTTGRTVKGPDGALYQEQAPGKWLKM